MLFAHSMIGIRTCELELVYVVAKQARQDLDLSISERIKCHSAYSFSRSDCNNSLRRETIRFQAHSLAEPFLSDTEFKEYLFQRQAEDTHSVP